MVRHTTHVRVSKEIKEQLDSLKRNAEDTYSNILFRVLPSKKNIWKDRLYQDFKSLEEDFPKKVSILEYMRIVLFNSMDLPKELTQKHDKEMELRLNELSHYGLELKKNGVNTNSHAVNHPKTDSPKVLDKENDVSTVNHVVNTGEDDDLDKYTYIKELPEPQLGLCDKCESDEVYWVADCVGDNVEKLCYDCGLLIKAYLEGNGGVFE